MGTSDELAEGADTAPETKSLWRKAIVAVISLGFMVSVVQPASAATVLCSSTGWACDTSGYGANSGNSYWGQYVGHNCTNYVAYRMIQNGSPLRLSGVPGNAKNWANYLGATYGIPVDATPAVGAIAHWNAYEGGYAYSEGHVAYVSEVGAGYIIVEEDNWQTTNRRVRFTVGEAAYPKRFIHVKDVGPAGGGQPFGFLDAASSPAAGILHVAGWAADPDAPQASIDVHVYANSIGFNLGQAGQQRDDVANAHPGYGSSHGFSTDLSLSAGGSYSICAYGINIGGGSNQQLRDCRTVNVADPQPFGYLDEVTSTRPGTITVRGWAVDPSDPRTSVEIHAYSDQKYTGATIANQRRDDVDTALPGYGPMHGYSKTFSATAGVHRVCTYAINIGVGDNQELKACKTVTVAPVPPSTPAPSPTPAPVSAPEPSVAPVAAPSAAPSAAPVTAPRIGSLTTSHVRSTRRHVAVISWAAAENATSYRFRMSRPDGRKKWMRWTATPNTWMRVKKLRRGAAYQFQVQAIGDGGASAVAQWRFVYRR